MNKTEQNLSEAFDRIKNGTTINIPKSKKLSFSAVEDEAGVSRSLLRSYPALFEKIKEQILLNKLINQKKNIVNNDKQNKLKEELNIEKQKFRIKTRKLIKG